MKSPEEIIGEIIAQRWKILSYLGEGNMSYVYKVQDTETGKIITLKRIKSLLLSKIADVDLLAKQAKLFIALNQENIASYYDVHLNDKGLFLFCDYLSGETLASLLGKTGKLPLEKCIKLCNQLVSGLQYAHEKKMLHGDFRPSNIFIVNDQFNSDEPKIVDFGIMHLIESISVQNDLHISATHPMFGDAPYMSPEQRLGQNIDARSDLYSFGCLMYEMACGRPPFSGKSAMETTYRQKNETPTELQQLLPAHPLLLRYQLVANKLLRHNPKDRYQSTLLLEQDLNLISTSKETEWQKKANVLKTVRDNVLVKQWPAALCIAFITIVVATLCAILPIIGPYYLPWKDKFFDDNKLWIIQAQSCEKPSISLLQHRDYLVYQLQKMAQSQSKFSPAYIQTLFALMQDLLACGQYNDALNSLCELKNNPLTSKLIDSTELSTNLAFAQYASGDLSHAETTARTALNLSEKGNRMESKIAALKILGDIQSEKNDLLHAENLYTQMYNLAKTNRLKNAAEYAYADALLADIWRRENKLKNAEQLYKEAIDWGGNYVGHHGIFMAKASYGLALIYYQEGNFKSANFQLKQALPIALARLGEKSGLVNAIKSLSEYILFHENIFAWYKAKFHTK